jgi:hypothetical protein
MKLLAISLTRKCNLRCPWCVGRPWVNAEPAADYAPLSNVALLPFLGKASPGEFFVELTGGEPALYDGLDELLGYLERRGFRGTIRTNGLLPVRKTAGFKRIAAFHDYGNPPKYYDVYLIIKQLDWERKAKYCEENEIPYKLTPPACACEPPPKPSINEMAFVTDGSMARSCHHGEGGRMIWEMDEIIASNVCERCKTFVEFERFFPPEEW